MKLPPPKVIELERRLKEQFRDDPGFVSCRLVAAEGEYREPGCDWAIEVVMRGPDGNLHAMVNYISR